MGMMFSTVEPIIALFAFTFFLVKFHIDKYNLSFVYNKEFEGGGVIKSRVIPFVLFGVFLFQIMNIGFFSLKFGSPYLIGGLCLIVLETLVICISKAVYDRRKKNLSKKHLMKRADEDL